MKGWVCGMCGGRIEIYKMGNLCANPKESDHLEDLDKMGIK